jgi:AcrR family transcriptional regulator
MPRPSRQLDRGMLAAGRALYAEAGCAGLSVRRIAEQAGVNPAMFHYHFGNRDAFVRVLLQSLYDEMFADLTVAADDPAQRTPERLRAALRVIARFVRDRRGLLRHLARDAFAGEPAVVAFVKTNLPRHLGLVGRLVAQGQREGVLRAVPLPQALSFIVGAMGAPILAGAALAESGLAPPDFAATFDADVLSDAALDERIDLVLAGLATHG